MNVKNRKCIRKLSLKSLYANRRRNLIAIFAIALTTLLFTSMFTIVLSLNASYETYQFRQVGGYAHGTFKDVSPEQAERIAAHPKVKAAGIRKVIGITAEGVFAKVPAEISYMDANCTKWSYATPTTGRMPESGKEVAMDTAALQLLGVTPELGAEVTVSYSITDKDQTAFTVTDTFTLVGYWDYDELMPVHYINISRDYADDIEAQAVKTGLQPFRTDLNVMMASSTNIQGQMEQVDTDLGYKAMYQKFSFVAIQIQMIKFLSHKHTSTSLASLYWKAGERTNLRKRTKISVPLFLMIRLSSLNHFKMLQRILYRFHFLHCRMLPRLFQFLYRIRSIVHRQA